MTFLHPIFLFGMLTVALPVLIHIFSKPKLTRVRWGANRFLIASIQKNSRKLFVEDWLLLLLRCLLFLLIALFFARPALLMSVLGLSFTQEPIAAVMIVDQSASMGQSDGSLTRFDKAKAMGSELISKLASGSSCALYLSSDDVKEVIAKPTTDFSLFRRVLDQAPLTDKGSNLYPALKNAIQLLRSVQAKRKEIFILTDSQLSAWKDLQGILRLQGEIKKEIGLNFFILGEHGEDNLAVSAMALSGKVPAANQPLGCSIQVSNWGKKPADKVVVKLALDDEAPQDETMIDRIEPGASRSVNLSVRPHAPGYHSLTASIPGDRLPSDNQRSLAVMVFEQIHALVIEGTDNPDPVKRDAFFLSQALAPISPEQADLYYMKVIEGRPAQLESPAIKQNELIFLCNVSQLTPVGAQNLRQYVNQGGTLVVFPGPSTDVSYYNEGDFGALLPAKLAASIDVTGAQKYLTWQNKDYLHPIVTLWNKPEAGTLGNVRFFHYFPLTPRTGADERSSAQVVLKYNNGEPAVVTQNVGKGKVFLFGSTATTQWNTLPIHPAFVPLLARLTAFATGDVGGNLNISPGQSFRSEVDSEYAGKDVYVQRVGEKKKQIAGKVEQGDNSCWLQYNNTDLAGAYALYIGEDVKPHVVFAVQGDPEESNLAQKPSTEIAPLLNAPTPDSGSGSKDTAQSGALQQRVPGKELWLPLAIMILLLAIIETSLAHWFSQSK